MAVSMFSGVKLAASNYNYLGELTEQPLTRTVSRLHTMRVSVVNSSAGSNGSPSVRSEARARPMYACARFYSAWAQEAIHNPFMRSCPVAGDGVASFSGTMLFSLKRI